MHGEDEEFPPPMPIWQQPWKGQDVEPTQFVFDCSSPTSPAASPADQTLAPPTPPKREGGSDTESEKNVHANATQKRDRLWHWMPNNNGAHRADHGEDQ